MPIKQGPPSRYSTIRYKVAAPRMKMYEDRFWTSRDGLKLHYRDYNGTGAEAGATGDSLLPVLCLHGLTRNARDFETLAERLAAERRVICPDLRGRGDSEYARDSATYTPQQYVEDVLLLIEEEGLQRFIVIGTSLGGLMAMGLASVIPDRIAAMVLNDVGPQLELPGLARIKDSVGQGRTFPTWVHAARGLEDSQGANHPGQPLDFWIGMAKRLMTVGGNGRIVFDYDMKIAEPFLNLDVNAQADLWPLWEGLPSVPILIVRGAVSDLFSAQTARRMVEKKPNAEAVTLPDVGHAPTLDEPPAIAAIDRLLARAR